MSASTMLQANLQNPHNKVRSIDIILETGHYSMCGQNKKFPHTNLQNKKSISYLLHLPLGSHRSNLVYNQPLSS